MKRGKSKTVGYILAFFFGGLGAHLFYYGKYLRGILYLAFSWTGIPILLGWIDMFFIHKWHQQYLESQENSSKFLQEKPLQSITPRVEKTRPEKVESEKSVLSYRENEMMFYREEDIILPEYAYLKTPSYIKEEIQQIKKSFKHKDLNRPVIEISFHTHETYFMEDSIKYANQMGVKTEFVPLQVYWTTFRDLDEKQKKWYFYWRHQTLKGNYLNTDLSYVILFVYELINYTFNQNAAFNVSMMVRLQQAYKERIPNLDRYLSEWIRDMLIELNEIELARKWGLGAEPYYQMDFYQIFKVHEKDISKIPIKEWQKVIRGYSETNFFEMNKQKVYNTFKEALKLFQKINIEEGLELEKAWFEQKKKTVTYYLFKSAVIGRNVGSGVIEYTEYVPTEYFYNEITALFRVSENVTRLCNGVKRQIQANEELLPPNFKKRLLEEMKNKKVYKTDEDVGIKSRFSRVVTAKVGEKGSRIPPKPNETLETKIANNDSNKSWITELDGKQVEALKQKHQDFLSEFSSDEQDEDKSTEREIKAMSNVEKTKLDIPERPTITLSDDDVDVEGFLSSLTEEEIEFISMFSSKRRRVDVVNDEIREKGIPAAVFINEINTKAEEYLDDVFIEQMGDDYVINEELVCVLEEIERSKAI